MAARLFAGTPWDIPPRCDRCGELSENCRCPPPRTPPEKQTARIVVEKRARGKVVTVIRGLAADNDFADLLKHLKNACGAGGAIDGDTLEVQGKHAETIQRILTERGYKVRL